MRLSRDVVVFISKSCVRVVSVHSDPRLTETETLLLCMFLHGFLACNYCTFIRLPFKDVRRKTKLDGV